MPGPMKPCEATGCKRHVPTEMLMCGPHWGQVPHPVQTAVYAEWRGYRLAVDRGEPEQLLRAIEAHDAAVADAVRAVEEANDRLRAMSR